MNTVHTSHAQANREAVELLRSRRLVEDGDLVIITKGDLGWTAGPTQ
jgi:pyruvate kinase